MGRNQIQSCLIGPTCRKEDGLCRVQLAKAGSRGTTPVGMIDCIFLVVMGFFGFGNMDAIDRTLYEGRATRWWCGWPL